MGRHLMRRGCRQRQPQEGAAGGKGCGAAEQSQAAARRGSAAVPMAAAALVNALCAPPRRRAGAAARHDQGARAGLIWAPRARRHNTRNLTETGGTRQVLAGGRERVEASAGRGPLCTPLCDRAAAHQLAQLWIRLGTKSSDGEKPGKRKRLLGAKGGGQEGRDARGGAAGATREPGGAGQSKSSESMCGWCECVCVCV